jgi:hypothetical protein
MKTEAVLVVVILGVWGLCISAHADPWEDAAEPFTFRDFNIDCNDHVNFIDRIIANLTQRDKLSSDSVSSPCPLR